MALDRTDTGKPGNGSQEDAARRALDNLAELEPELRGAAIFDGIGSDRRLLAASEPDPEWAEAAGKLADAVETAAVDEFDSAHVALSGGEAFVVAEAGMTLVATTDRFVLASLTGYDMRMTLRDLAAKDAAAREAT